MFGHHRRHCGERHFAPHPFGFHGHHGMGRGGMGRGGPGRFFDQGDLRFVLLKLIGDQPSHGYELIKAVEQAAGGAYSPSPGVIYPTLTLLEDLGYVTVSEPGGGKKLYTLSDEGRAFLAENAEHVQRLFARLAEVSARSAVNAPQILRAMENLRTALKIRLTGAPLTADQVAALAKVLDEAASAVEQV